MGRRAIAAVALVAVVATLALSGCGSESTKPTTYKLGDLDLTLELSRSAITVSDTVTAAVIVHGAPAGVLDSLTCAWRWGGQSRFGPSETGMTRALVQPTAPGRLEVEVIVGLGEDTAVLTAGAQVAAGAVDGSRDMLTVFEGPFLRGEQSTQTAFESNTPQRTLTLSRFALARTEMTNATCAAALNWAAARGFVELSANPAWLVWPPDPERLEVLVLLDLEKCNLVWNGSSVSVPAGYELHPVTGVTWPGAAALCNWLSVMDGLEPCYTFTPTVSIHLYDITCDFFRDGYRLPTEAEWEKAARGALVFSDGANPLPDRRYPWGNEAPRVELAYGVPGSVRANVSFLNESAERLRGPIFSGSLPVGSFPLGAGPYGHLDLLGNAAEWCYDWFDLGYYTVAPETDPLGVAEVLPTVTDIKALRGDSWSQAYIPGLSAYTLEEGCGKRRWSAYMYRASDLGFRAARSER